MISVIEINESDRNYWDREIAKFENVHPLNAFGWGKVRSIDGWSPTYLMAKKGDSITGAVMLLTKRIPLIGLSIMYAPRGPVYDLHDNETLKTLLNRIRMEARKSHAIFLRIDPNISEEAMLNTRDPFLQEGFVHLAHRWSFWNAPRDVFRIDLTKAGTEDQLFKTLDRQARKAVRKSRKQGVTVRHATSMEEFNIFFRIFKEFSTQRGFMSRDYAYQKSLWGEFITRGNGRLFLAIYQGQIVGGLLCLIFGQKCLAMHMGTPNEYQHLRTNDAYVWEAIRSVKENNCRWFSFRGVGSSASESRFKRKFGPEAVYLVGYYDLAFYPLLHHLFCTFEFKIVPRVMTMLMYLRKKYKDLSELLKGS